jgi:uncharacterized protein YggE
MAFKCTFIYPQMVNVNEYSSNKISCKDAQIPIIIVIFGIFAGMIMVFFTVEVSAQNTSESTMGNTTKDTASVNSTVHTTGASFARLQPDRVFVTIGVETTANTANAALSENSELMSRIVSELSKQGLMQNETSTSSFNIYPLYNFTESGTRLNVSGFNVLTSIRIETPNLDNISDWIDTAVALGANDVNEIRFTVSNNQLESVKNSLITDAIADAKQKAETAASAIGLKVAGVKSLNIEESAPPAPEPLFRGDIAAQAAEGTPPPILPGEQEVSMSVSGVFLVR